MSMDATQSPRLSKVFALFYVSGVCSVLRFLHGQIRRLLSTVNCDCVTLDTWTITRMLWLAPALGGAQRVAVSPHVFCSRWTS